MSKKYTHLFFDLDNTLWDYDANSYEALKIVLEKLGIIKYIGDYSQFYSVYHSMNEQLWIQYREKKITKEEMRFGRFEKSLEANGTPMKGVGRTMNEVYLKEMPLQSKLVDGASEVLDYLHGKYFMAILTNGFIKLQSDKITESGLKKYFEKIFISESIGSQKPDSLIFEHAIQSVNASEDSILMIGDSWETDVIGAMEMGIDQIFYSPKLQVGDSESKIVEIQSSRSLSLVESNKGCHLDKKSSTRIISHLKQLTEIL
jgi:putative hydrolase of the HAD superfamily